jgi:predicted Zn-dependent protease with MMP-like domain
MLTRQEFEELVDQALEEIPPEFLEKLENVEILVEEEPSRELLREVGLRGGTLFGLYQGIPETHKSSFHFCPMPDRILIFRRPILRACRTRGQVVREIRKTVMHEVAHHFGFSEERLRELGYG